MLRQFCELLQAPARSVRGKSAVPFAREKCLASTTDAAIAITADKIALAGRFR